MYFGRVVDFLILILMLFSFPLMIKLAVHSANNTLKRVLMHTNDKFIHVSLESCVVFCLAIGFLLSSIGFVVYVVSFFFLD